MSYIIAVASGKGGVGKTLVTATLAVSLAKKGYSVLAADADMGLRDLDLLFGVQDEVLYDAVDVMKQRCTAEEAIIPVMPQLDFLAASQKHTWEKVDAPTFQYTLESLAPDYDYILIDCPPGRGRAYKDAVAIADEILFVVEPSWSSIRDASRVMQFCNKHKQFHYAALLNNFYDSADGFVPVKEALESLPAEHVAGVLPHDSTVNRLAQEGYIVHLDEKIPFYQAMEQTIAYLTGHVPVSIPDLVKFLPLEEQPAHVSKGTEEKRTCETNAAADEAIPAGAMEELVKAAAHVIPGSMETTDEPEAIVQEQADAMAENVGSSTEPGSDSQSVSSLMRVSLKQRRNQSRMWRQYRR